MARIEVVTHVEAPPERVWEVLTEFERQGDWMVDLRSIKMLSEQRAGVGVAVRCYTDILGVAVRDDMVVTEWEPSEVLGVRHIGRLIAGVAAFELTPTELGTRLVWWEEVDAPLGGIGDAVAGLVIVPWVTKVFRRSLARLKRISESEVRAGGA